MKRLPVVTYDPSADAAYIQIGVGKVASTQPIEVELDGNVVLDLDAEGRILGIEIVGATSLLDKGLIDQAARGNLVLRALVKIENAMPRPPYRPR